MIQIVINNQTGVVDVITLNNGIPVLPSKSLDTKGNTLTPQEKVQYQSVIDLILQKAK